MFIQCVLYIPSLYQEKNNSFAFNICHSAGHFLGSCPCAQIIGAFLTTQLLRYTWQRRHTSKPFLTPGQLNLMLHNYHLKKKIQGQTLWHKSFLLHQPLRKNCSDIVFLFLTGITLNYYVPWASRKFKIEFHLILRKSKNYVNGKGKDLGSGEESGGGGGRTGAGQRRNADSAELIQKSWTSGRKTRALKKVTQENQIQDINKTNFISKK